MPTARRNDLAKLLRLALEDLDTQITDLREMRAKLGVMINRPSEASAVGMAALQKRRTLSAAARAKIGAAAKARWDSFSR